jgi:hypothetical protein
MSPAHLTSQLHPSRDTDHRSVGVFTAIACGDGVAKSMINEPKFMCKNDVWICDE